MTRRDHHIEFAPAAARQLRKLDPLARRRIQAVLELLAALSGPPGAKKLAGGDGEWRIRTGGYRVIYEVHDQVLLILAVAVGHRRETYRS